MLAYNWGEGQGPDLSMSLPRGLRHNLPTLDANSPVIPESISKNEIEKFL